MIGKIAQKHLDVFLENCIIREKFIEKYFSIKLSRVDGLTR